MLYAMPWKSCRITKAERSGDCLYLYSDRGMHRIEPKSATVVRITYTEREAFSEREKPGVVRSAVWGDWEFTEDTETVEYCSPKLHIVIQKESASFAYYNGKGGAFAL